MRHTHLNPAMTSLGGIDPPAERLPGYVAETKCPCGYHRYRMSVMHMVKTYDSPKIIEICAKCGRARMDVRSDVLAS